MREPRTKWGSVLTDPSLLDHNKKFSGTSSPYVHDAQLASLDDPQILVIGCGGAGNNCINRIHRDGITGAKTVALNTDKQHLDMIEADTRLLIGTSITYGLGAGGYPNVGRRCAKKAVPLLEELFEDVGLVFVVAGLGGGTGTGSAPVVAAVAKRLGAIVIGVATTPFLVERARMKHAESGLWHFRGEADAVLVLDNNRLLRLYPHLPINEAFSTMDRIISDIVKGITETITRPSMINIDFADIRSIVSLGGLATMMYSTNNDLDPDAIVETTLKQPLFGVDYTKGKGALVHFSGGPDLTLETVNTVANRLTCDLDPHANIILGARIDHELRGAVKVMTIVTGIRSQGSHDERSSSRLNGDEKYPSLGSRAEVSTEVGDLVPTIGEDYRSPTAKQQQQFEPPETDE